MKSSTRRLVNCFIFILSLFACTAYLTAQTAVVVPVQQDGGAIRASGNGAVPRAVKYGGSLAAGQAVPTEGTSAAASTAQVTFALYADEQSSTPLWVETQTVSVDGQGKYSVLLGATSPNGLAPELFVAGESRWLGVKSGDAAEQRVLLVSVPYALKAQDSDTIAGHKITDFLLTPEAAAAAGIAVPRVPTVNVDNGTGGVTNQVSKWTNATTLGNSIITDTGTAVGIGVANPAFTIDIKNTDATAAGSNIFRLQTPSVNGAVMHFLSTSANGHDWAFGSNFINGVGEFGVYDYTANTARLFINATGSVGINTSVPQFTMDIQNSDATGAGANIFRMRTPSVNGAVMHFQSTAANGHDWGFGSNFITGTGEFGFYDYTAGAARVFITGTGNVGIGTNAPTANLEVAGAAKFNSTVNVTGALTSGAHTVTGNITASGTVTATSFVGSGANLTNLPAGLTVGASVTGSTTAAILYATQQSSVANTSAIFSNGFSTGLRGDSTVNTSGIASGVLGTAQGPNSYGVFGINVSSATGVNNNAVGVFGESFISTPGGTNLTNGTGVWGQADATAGDAVGVYGQTSSIVGTGVLGASLSTSASSTSDGTGVFGTTKTPGGAGVWGTSTAATPTSGTLNIGVYGSASASGVTASVAGLFDTFAGITSGFNILIGRNVVPNGSGGFNATNVFRVDATGKGFFANGQQTGGADFAESVEMKDAKSNYEPGDVLAIDTTGVRRFTMVSKPYSTLVSGIYATKPGVLATPRSMDDPRIAKDDVPMAVIGIVPCKVTNENGDIEVGDLLVSSSTPGKAMKGTDRARMTGAVVGKALQAMHGKSGVVEVLVSLQ